MKYIVVSVLDRAAGAFGRPIFVVAAGQAIRSFQDEVNRVGAQNDMNLHPADFVLYEIGEFHDEDGTLVALPSVKVLATGVQCVVPKGGV